MRLVSYIIVPLFSPSCPSVVATDSQEAAADVVVVVSSILSACFPVRTLFLFYFANTRLPFKPGMRLMCSLTG